MLHAPGGAGKTTVAAQWAADARAAGDHVGWYDAAAGGADPQELLAGLAAPGERAALVVDRAEALGVDRLLALVDLVRRSPDRHLVLCLRAAHAVVLRLRTEVETELLTAADLALDAVEVAALVGPAGPEVLAWTGGHAGTVAAGLPGPAEPGGWSRERARASLVVRLDEAGAAAAGVGLLAALGTRPLGSALLTSVLTGLGGDPLGALEQVASVEVGAAGLRVRVTPALQEALAALPAVALPAEALARVVRLRWWELLRADPARLTALVAALEEDGGGPVAAQLRAEGLVGPGQDPVVARVPVDLEACAVRIAAGRRRGDLRAAVDAVRRGEALLREGADDPDTLRSFALHAGLAGLDTGDLASARGWWLRAHRATPGGDGEAAALLALLAAIEGDQEAVAAWSPLAADDAEARRLAHAVAELDAGDVRAAGRWLGGATAADGDLWYLAAGLRAALALLTPARPEALQVLRRQRAEHADLAPAGSMARCVLSLAEVDLLLASGRATEAAVLLESLPDSAATRLLRGRLALMTDDLPTAAAELAAVAHPPATLRRLRMEALLLTVETHRRAGRTVAARYASDQLALRAPWPRLGHLVPGGPVYPATAEVVRLTARERELLALLRGPLPRDSIASTLYVSTNTVKTQLQGLYRKLGVATREEAVERAFTLGLLD